MQSEMEELIKAAQDVIDERDSELDMMTCKYPLGTTAHEAWHNGVYEMWKRLDVIKGSLKPAIAAARASEGGWIEIKEGCEMPPNDTRVMVHRRKAHPGTDPEYGFHRVYLSEKYPFGYASSHYRLLPSPPLSVETPGKEDTK